MARIQLYDDQAIIFLGASLRQIPYLAECAPSTISALAMSMKQDFLEPGAIYYKVGDQQGCLSII